MNDEERECIRGIARSLGIGSIPVNHNSRVELHLTPAKKTRDGISYYTVNRAVSIEFRRYPNPLAHVDDYTEGIKREIRALSDVGP